MRAGEEGPMADWAESGGHPDEGTIHAWLDGALDADEAARVETHVASCASCASRVAEARGLIAGASRVVRMLDDAPAPLLRPASTPTVSASGSAWRMLRVTPARAAIAAVLLVAVGITLTNKKVAVESPRSTAAMKSVDSTAPMVATVERMDAPAAPAALPRPQLPMQDSVLRSAVARRIASEQPQRVVEPSRDAAIPTAPPPSIRADSTKLAEVVVAGAAVARGRAQEQMRGVARGAVADNAAAAPAPSAPVGAGCFRLESRGGTPTDWRGVPLPLEIVLSASAGAPGDRGEPRFAIRTPNEERAIGAWTRSAGDTLSLTMFGATATTSALLVPGDNTRQGYASVVAQSKADAMSPAASLEKSTTLRANTGGVQIVARRIPCR